jgi:hypothetical protein
MPAGNTYEAIATQTLGSAAATVTFSSIPQTYTDLVLVINGKTSIAGGTTLELNGDTGSNYSFTTLLGDGSAASSARGTAPFMFYLDTDPSLSVLQFMNYSNTTTYKTALLRNNNSLYVFTRSILWRSTSAISSMLISSTNSNTYLTGTTFSLYGIKSA